MTPRGYEKHAASGYSRGSYDNNQLYCMPGRSCQKQVLRVLLVGVTSEIADRLQRPGLYTVNRTF